MNSNFLFSGRSRSQRVGSKWSARRGFSLVEVMVAMAILSVLMLIISQMLGQMQRTWSSSVSKLSHFRDGRRVFDVMKRNLSQATLNTYLRYLYAGGGGNPFSPFGAGQNAAEVGDTMPTQYVRFSELQFICGPAGRVLPGGGERSNPGHALFFYAPLGFSGTPSNMPSALNGRGYFVEYGGDGEFRPPFLQSKVSERFRYRLMEYLLPTENITVYDNALPYAAYATRFNRWAEGNVEAWARPVADNIVALYVSPKGPLVTTGGGGIVGGGSSGGNRGGDGRSGIAPEYFFNSADPAFLGGGPQPAYSHQLPPAVELVMVVIDEQSAVNLARTEGNSAPLDLGSLGLFSQGASEDGFRQDLVRLQEFMNEQKINYRVFTSTVSLRNSRWNG
jgi:uncharacterized protein (TIGR02599 family)